MILTGRPGVTSRVRKVMRSQWTSEDFLIRPSCTVEADSVVYFITLDYYCVQDRRKVARYSEES